MRQTPDLAPDSPLEGSIDALLRIRAHRIATQAIESDALHRVLYDAGEENLSLRDLEALTGISRPTLARERLRDAIQDQPGPPAPYDEDEWIAAEDLCWRDEPEMQNDRGPWRVEENTDGTRAITCLHLGSIARLSPATGDQTPEKDPNEHDDAYEPLKGITPPEYDHLMTEGLDGERSQRIVRRLARAVLRVLHPGMPRTGIVLDAAIQGVCADIPGAMVLTGQATPTAEKDEGWVSGLRGRRAQGFYLPKWDQDPAGEHQEAPDA